ncbi:40s ribosomal protein s6-like [Lynx pardinus]|uniref:Small ribosomal subunit protein eS6 n=1 Tax=Lynx pardinus TaxID=191816 RepID=A0A485MLQ0_LYNPA|nr:40s ribosomal protein s6-like [Lynx pardinus]
MKLNISFPATGCQKLIGVNDERKLRTFDEKHMATEVAVDALSTKWKGYVVRISDQGGLEKESTNLPRDALGNADLSVLNLVIVKKRKKAGEKDILGLTSTTVPRRLGPQRASGIRKLFSLSKEDGVCRYVVKKPLNKEGKKPRTKAPEIQHLFPPRVFQQTRRRITLKK